MAERRVLWAVNQAGTTLGCIANMLAVIVFVTARILIVFAILRRIIDRRRYNKIMRDRAGQH